METIKPISNGEYRTGKTNDCSVRALSNATLLEYEECEDLLLHYGRRLNEGATLEQISKSCVAFGLRNIQAFGLSNHYKMTSFGYQSKQQKGITLKNFLKQNQKGRFVVLYSKHVIAVVDGQVVDTIENNPNVFVIAAFSNSWKEISCFISLLRMQ